jgi:multiple sugar transport system permease protein/putative spermidine/putrescine transport system permease protein
MSGSWFLRNGRLRWLLAGLLFAAAVVVFLAPIGVAVLWSLVNPEEGWFPPDIVPPSYSFANWRALFAVPELADACLTSFAIATMVTLLCALLGLPSGYAIGRRPLRLRRVLELLVLTPLMLPSVVIATGLGSLFIRLGLAQTMGGVVLVQTVVVLPFMIRIVAATFEGMPQDVIDAARNLGAGPLGLTWHVLVPLVLPGLMAGALLSFIGSLQEFLLTFVVGMPRVQTLPILLWSYLGGRSSIWTYGAVVSLVMLAPTVIILFIAERVLKQEYLAAGFGKA